METNVQQFEEAQKIRGEKPSFLIKIKWVFWVDEEIFYN